MYTHLYITRHGHEYGIIIIDDMRKMEKGNCLVCKIKWMKKTQLLQMHAYILAKVYCNMRNQLTSWDKKYIEN